MKKRSSLDDKQLICCCDSPNLSSAFRMLTTVIAAGARLDETDGVQVEAAAGFRLRNTNGPEGQKIPRDQTVQ